MLKILNKRKWLIIGASILAILNLAAFYILRKGIEIANLIKHTENETIRNSFQQKQILSDVLPSLVFTIDIALIFFGCYLLIKMVLKSLKKSTPTK
ncbi:hypothetical protein [Kaistella sp.]|uniref:hypothetical protein n=1 Tax=Kaistella sp. TaxID=2782235 RepID=UPI003C3624D0